MPLNLKTHFGAPSRSGSLHHRLMARAAPFLALGALFIPLVGSGAPGDCAMLVDGPSTPLEPAPRPKTAVMRAFVPARIETVRTSPVEPARAEPTANYPSLEVARDSLGAMVRRSVAPGDTAIHIRRERVTFKYWYARASARGWAFHVGVNDTSACPNSALESALSAAGWVRDYNYQADGPDGESCGFVSRKVLCVIDAQWDGGDDSDSTYVPVPGCTVTVTCVPRRSDDVPPK